MLNKIIMTESNQRPPVFNWVLTFRVKYQKVDAFHNNQLKYSAIEMLK